MKDHTLIRSQRAKVFASIVESGMNASDFDLSNKMGKYGEGEISALSHIPSGYYYNFDYKHGWRHSIFSPGVDDREEGLETQTFYLQMENLKAWLERLRKKRLD